MAAYGARWVGAALGTPRRGAGVYHVVDHSLAHALAVLPARRTVLTCHDLIPMRAAVEDLGFVPGTRARAQFWFSARQVARAAALVAVSETTRADMERFLGIPPATVEVIPLGVDGAFHAPTNDARACRRRKYAWTDRFVIVQVGSAPYKNVETALRVYSEVRRRGIDAVFVHVGAPLAPSESRDPLVLQHIAPSDADLAHLMGAADCLLFPSLWEGFGLPPLEAMACATPVVTSTAPALAEICGDAALRAGAQDVRALADAVCSVATDPLVAAGLRARGLSRVARYTWIGCAERYRAVYDRVAEFDDRRRT